MFTFLIATILAANVISDVPTPKLDNSGKLDCEFLRFHHSFLQRAREGNIGVLFLGDSITNGWSWGDHAQIWNRYFAQYDPANFGVGGDRTEHVLWRIENGELDRIHPKVVVLLIGTNNIADPADDIGRGVLKIVERIHQKLPKSRLLLMGIFPRGADPGDPKVAAMREKIAQVNQTLAKLEDRKRTRFLDIGSKFLAPDGTLPKEVMPDSLHLNYRGYQIWAEALKPLLDQMMK
jgi:lysophospholipase L1-like esterase